MRVHPACVGGNTTEIVTDAVAVLFSYQTPVAAHIFNHGYVRTSKKWSRTTSKHINKWLENHGERKDVEEREQEFFDKLVIEIGK